MPEGPGWSLRRRLLLICALGMGLALALGGLAMFWAETIEDRETFDARLEMLGATVLSLVEIDEVRSSDGPRVSSSQLETEPATAMLLRYQVWSKEGALLLRSREAPADRPMVDLTRRGLETVRIGGEEHRALALQTKDGRVVQVARRADAASTQVGRVALYYVGILLVPLALVFGVSWLLTRRSLRSIDSLAAELQRRNPLDVTRLNIDNPPRELLPMLGELDLLFTRIGHAVSAERRFTAVAAHEMRTPLAGVRAQAQIASAARSEDESRQALRSVMQGVDRAAHMLDQLLDLARVEALPGGAELQFQPVKLADVFRNVMIDLQAKASQKRIHVDTHFDVPEMNGLGFGLHLILGNLLANAILYCPEGRRVSVASVQQGKDVVLTVDDSGLGIAASERDRAFERFNRLGQNKTGGVGLGLSIVLLVAELHGARVELLDAPIGGLRVRLSFPQRQARPAGAERLVAATA